MQDKTFYLLNDFQMESFYHHVMCLIYSFIQISISFASASAENFLISRPDKNTFEKRFILLSSSVSLRVSDEGTL